MTIYFSQIINTYKYAQYIQSFTEFHQQIQVNNKRHQEDKNLL